MFNVFAVATALVLGGSHVVVYEGGHILGQAMIGAGLLLTVGGVLLRD